MKIRLLLLCLLSFFLIRCVAPNKDDVASFLADNWYLDTNTWNHWSFSYRGGKDGGYVVQYRLSDTLYRQIIIIPLDSLIIRYCGDRDYTMHTSSIKKLPTDSVWCHDYSGINIDELLARTRFVLYNNLKSISGVEQNTEIQLFEKQGEPRLLRKTSSKIENTDHWKSMGADWYIFVPSE